VKSKIITTIPVFNGEPFILQTLESVARQTRRPDRVVVLDNGSTDRTEEIVRNFKAIPCEFIRNPRNLGLFGNMNRCLDFATETEYLHILHADDMIAPEFYKVMTDVLVDALGTSMAWCVDERVNENNQRLSFSGKVDGQIQTLSRDEFLRQKAELGNQAICATLIKTAGQPSPARCREDFPIMGDTVFWAALGAHCQKIIHVRKALGQYRWHGSNQTIFLGPKIESLIVDEWRTIEMNEALRGKPPSWIRMLKLKGLFAVRSGIKAKRSRQNGNATYAAEIAATARAHTGLPLWLAGKILVGLRDFYLFKIQRRTRHPKNIYG
jgi:glycosyltransferase involved in cell wall biosynthesis